MLRLLRTIHSLLWISNLLLSFVRDMFFFKLSVTKVRPLFSHESPLSSSFSVCLQSGRIKKCVRRGAGGAGRGVSEPDGRRGKCWEHVVSRNKPGVNILPGRVCGLDSAAVMSSAFFQNSRSNRTSFLEQRVASRFPLPGFLSSFSLLFLPVNEIYGCGNHTYTRAHK